MASTRLCVKGLPKHLTKERLREHFETIGEVTDARVCTTSDGKSRCFGFVGFRTEKEAIKAKKHFNNSFIDTSKIAIEIAKPVGDGNLVRPWSKYSTGSSAHERLVRKTGKKESEPTQEKKAQPVLTKEQEILQKIKTDPEMRAFVEAMKPRRKGKIWENDDELLTGQEVVVKQEVVKSKKTGGDGLLLTRTHMKFESEESDDEYQDAPAAAAEDAEGGGPGRTVYVKNLNFATAEPALRKAFERIGPVRAVKIMTKVKGAARLSMGYGFVEFADASAAGRAVREMEGARLDGHVLQVKLSERHRADGAAEEPRAQRPAAAGKAGGEGCTKLMIRNVPFEATKKELHELLAAFGQLTSLRIPKKMDGAHRGFAFAEFLTHAEAEAARTTLQNTHLYGRHLVFEYAEESNSLEALRLKTARYLSHLQAPGDRASKRQKLEATLEGDDDAAFADGFDA